MVDFAHIQYLRWMEDSVPMITSPVLEISILVQKVQMGSGNKPIASRYIIAATPYIYKYIYIQ